MSKGVKMAIIKTRKHSRQNRTIVKKHSVKKHLKKTMKGGANGKLRIKPKKPVNPKIGFLGRKKKNVKPEAMTKYKKNTNTYINQLREYKTAKKTRKQIKKGNYSPVETIWNIPLKEVETTIKNRGVEYAIPLEGERHLVKQPNTYTHTNTQGQTWNIPLVEVSQRLKNITRNAKEREKLTKEETKAAKAEEKLKAKTSGRVPLPSVELFPFGGPSLVKVNPLYENFKAIKTNFLTPNVMSLPGQSESSNYSSLIGPRPIIGVSTGPYAQLGNFRSTSGSVSSKESGESGYVSGSSVSSISSNKPKTSIHEKGEVYYRSGASNEPIYSLPLLGQGPEALYAKVLKKK